MPRVTPIPQAGVDDTAGPLRGLQEGLLAAARAWAHGAELPPEVEETRHAAVRAAHLRYVRHVPAYRDVAESCGAAGPADLELIACDLMFSGLFKSYDPERLRAGDYAAMTEWLRSVSTGVPELELTGVGGPSAWRERLRQAGIFLSFSSGTSGRMSFVPRDRDTFRALVGNSASYADPSLPLAGFDCLVLGPRGDGVGLLDAGNGLARASRRSHFLFAEELSADAVSGGAPLARGQDRDAADEAAAAFVRAAIADAHPLLVFGAPFQVRGFAERVLARFGRLAAPEGSVLVTGGGWKSFAGEKLSRPELLRLAGEALGLAPERCIDSYSTAEINAALASCREGRYHVPPLMEAVVLDEALQGAPGRPGKGLLGFLDPFAMSYPGFVITGDRAALGRGRSGCGRSGTFLDGEIERAPGAEIRGCGGLLGSMLA
jgi:hypothetical protein